MIDGDTAADVARVVAATMFLTAGTIRLARWWVTRDARSAYMIPLNEG